jgi:hypothetical protein
MESTATQSPQWAVDPTGRYAQRYWAGDHWTPMVAGLDGGEPFHDGATDLDALPPLGWVAPPPPPTSPEPAAAPAATPPTGAAGPTGGATRGRGRVALVALLVAAIVAGAYLLLRDGSGDGTARSSNPAASATADYAHLDAAGTAVITPSDLPGTFTVAAEDDGLDLGTSRCTALRSALGVKGAKAARTSVLTQDVDVVEARVGLYDQIEAAQAADRPAADAARFTACAKQMVAATARARFGDTFGGPDSAKVTVRDTPLPAIGEDRVGASFVVDLRSGDTKAQVYADVVSMRVGRGLVFLAVLQAVNSPDPTLRDSLLRTIADRLAKAQAAPRG